MTKPLTNKQTVAIASREFFQIGLAAYVLLALAETLSRGTVSDYFDLNYILGAVILAGVLLVWCGSFDSLLYRRGVRNEAESINWVNAHNLRHVIRDRPQRLKRPLQAQSSTRGVPARPLPAPVRSAPMPQPHVQPVRKAVSRNIDGVIQK